MVKTKKLNELFDRWQKSIPEHSVSFVRDGVIDEAKFIQKDQKILLLCKEPNQSQGLGLWDFRDWWKESLIYSFSFCIADWAYGILNDFQPHDTIKDNDRMDAIRSIAFMNVKKLGGKGVAVWNDIDKYIKAHQALIFEEIDIIKPSVIVACIGCRRFEHSLFKGVSWLASGHGIDIALWRGIPLIDFYHPSGRAPRSMSYALVKLVFQSNSFQMLVKTAPQLSMQLS